MPNRAQETTAASSKQRAGRPGGTVQVRPDAALPTADTTYGIVSVLYHALQGAQTYQQYSEDARKAGDSELQEFFDTCRREEHARAIQAKSLLADRLAEEDEGGSEDDEDDEDDEDA